MSLHQSTHELLSTLASDKTDDQLRSDIADALVIDAVGSQPACGRCTSHTELVYSNLAWRTRPKTSSRHSRRTPGTAPRRRSTTCRRSRRRSCANPRARRPGPDGVLCRAGTRSRASSAASGGRSCSSARSSRPRRRRRSRGASGSAYRSTTRSSRSWTSPGRGS
jgi:hypothetical protein